MGRGGHIRLAVLAGAVVLAATGGAAIRLGLPDWLAGTIAGVAAIIAGVVSERLFEARTERAAALEALRLVLDPLTPPVHPAVTTGSVLSLLRTDRSPMPFRARAREMSRLAEWRSDKHAAPVLLLSGPTGVGKSRLAIEFGRRVPAGWVAGWLHAGTGAGAIGAVAARGEPAVILVDDADGRADLVSLLGALAGHHEEPVIRVLLVTRSASGLLASLAARLEERHSWIMSGAEVLELGVAGGPDDQARWFGEAVCAFATALGRPVPAMPDQVRPVIMRSEPFLMIMARALVAVLGCGEEDPARLRLLVGDVVEALLRHEKRLWDSTAREFAWGFYGAPAYAVRERAITALALLGDTEAEEVLRRLPELSDASAERLHAIASWISSLYPSGFGMIGEALVVSQLADPALSHALQRDLTEDQAAHALALLARAADWLPDIDPLLGQFAAGDLRTTVHERPLGQVIRQTGDAPTTTGRASGKHDDLGTVGRGEAGTSAADALLGGQSEMVISDGRQDLHEREQLIREISHSINTPLAQIELTLRGVAEATGDPRMIGALRRSEQGVQLCRAVLAAYRDITAVAAIATQWDIQDLRQALRSVVEVYKARGLELPEEVDVEIDMPGAIPGYSNYMITSLLLPLLQNAVEAAPSRSQIRCWGIRNDNHYLLCVSNAMRVRVDLGKLKLSNYTSKLGAHEGLGHCP